MHFILSFQYSETLGKLYINQNKFANFEFSVNTMPDECNLFVRAVCIFSSADDYQEPVKVFYTDSRDSMGNPKSNISEHLVRCDTDGIDFKTPWYRWTVGRLQQIFLMVSVALSSCSLLKRIDLLS